MAWGLTSCSEALKHTVQLVLVEYMPIYIGYICEYIYPLLDLVCCGFFSWVCFSVWFLFALLKYVNILSCSLFYLLGEAPLSLVFDSDLKSLHAQISYSVLMHHSAIS